MKKQTGGTLIGFVVGLIVGLGVALAVAVYITKVPIPLVDREVQRKPDQEAIEKERNRDWNPNTGLGGKQPAAAAPAEAQPAPAPAAPAAPTANAPAQQPAKADPLGELIQSRNTQGPGQVPTVEAADPFVYYVQAGAFRGPDEAEAQRARLAMLGFDAKVTEREQAGKPVFRVRLGPFEKKVDAEVMQERLTGQSVDNTLVRIQR